MQLHDYTILKSVRAVCPRCFSETPDFDPEFPTDICDGHLVTREGRVYLRRFCRRGHGEVWSLYEEDADLWQYLQQWRVPTRVVNPDTAQIYPVPMGYEHGLGPTHLQHSCIFLLDITTQCNLSCPACFTSSSPHASQFLSIEGILNSVRTAIDREGGALDVVMISGGEPTVHPQFRRIIESLCELPITRILVNTNGIRIAAEDDLLTFLQSLRHRVEVYLQYDGQREDTQRYLRGVDLRATKTKTVNRLSEAEVFTTLVMTVTKRNADQIGEVLDTAFSTRFVGGAMFQPVFGSGRSPEIDPLDRVTTTGVLRRMQDQSRYGVRDHDLIALPCSHPDCCSIGYFLKTGKDAFKGLASIVGEDVLKANLSVFGNSITFKSSMDELRKTLTGLMSETMTLSRPELASGLKALCRSCDLGGLTGLLSAAFGKGNGTKFVGERVKRVTVKHFMDADMLITERLEQCCVHVGAAGSDPVRMPFCAARLFPKVRRKAMDGAVDRAAVARAAATMPPVPPPIATTS